MNGEMAQQVKAPTTKLGSEFSAEPAWQKERPDSTPVSWHVGTHTLTHNKYIDVTKTSKVTKRGYSRNTCKSELVGHHSTSMQPQYLGGDGKSCWGREPSPQRRPTTFMYGVLCMQAPTHRPGEHIEKYKVRT